MTRSDSPRVLHLSEDAGKDFLRGLLLTGRCIPFLGAGFTAGEPAHRGRVPGGSEFMQMMRDAINASPTTEKPSSASLENYSFQALSDEYFREPIVGIEEIKTTLRNRFTGVSLTSEAKKDFLRWNWEYIYTLNIDDAIERELDAIKVLPFTDFSQHKTTQFVYKLHGDAADAVTAGTSAAMKLVFGSADYISSLIKNRALISTLTNDFVERHLLFIGCSLTDELDVLYALAHANSTTISALANNRVYITANGILDYETKKKLKHYGVTEVLVVDYAEFYSFVASIISPHEDIKSPLDSYKYDGKIPTRNTENEFLQYLLQISWNTHESPAGLAVSRDILKEVSPLITEPIVVLWGRRFSGRTTLLFEVLFHHSNRNRYLIPSSAAGSDKILNELLRKKDALIAVDTGAMSYPQLQRIVQKLDQIRENNTTIVLATNRASLSALGPYLVNSALEVKDRMSQTECKHLNAMLEPYGLANDWRPFVPHLDNIFSLANSPVVGKLLKQQSRLHDNITRLHQQWIDSPVGKLDFSVLFYIGTRQRIYSRYFRELAGAASLGHLKDSYFEDFSKKWEPFIEFEYADLSSSQSERSYKVIVSNANAWIHYAIRHLSLKLGAEETAKQIVHTFIVMKKVEDKAFELLLFDNLNAIFSEKTSASRASVILSVYEHLALHLSSDADYWLQRAKGIYYLSNKVDDLVVAAEYCEKSIVKRSTKTNTNAMLTKANLLGKICKLKINLEDSDIVQAIEAYVEAIESRPKNPLYIDELLRKSKTEKSYMNLVCRLARSRTSLLSHKHEIDFILSYAGERH